MNQPQVNLEGIGITKHFESCRFHAYQNTFNGTVDKVTIGWGNTFYKDGSAVKLGDTITQSAADDLFMFVVNQFADTIRHMITVPLTDNQFSALVDFAYNEGTGTFHGSHLLVRVNQNPHDTAIRDELMKYIYMGHTIENGLIARRKMEADLYFTV